MILILALCFISITASTFAIGYSVKLAVEGIAARIEYRRNVAFCERKA